MFFDMIKSQGSVCLGIDPHASNIPPFMASEIDSNGAESFLKQFAYSLIVAGVQAKVSSVKIQMAFFEAFGARGWEAMAQVISYAREKKIAVLLDGKRGDISSTMAAYGVACFDYLKADALTVMPYMGDDTFAALLPWLKKGKAVYSVCLPSNPSASIYSNDPPSRNFALKLAHTNYRLLERENVANHLGFVVGLSRFDVWVENAPVEISNSPLLLPGYGAQGASLSPTSLAKLIHRKCDLIPISRGISGFGDGHIDESLTQINDWEHYQHWVFQKISAFQNELKM